MNFRFIIDDRKYIGSFACAVVLSALAFAAQASAVCSDPNSPLAALIRSGDDDGKRIPLILVHGKGGTSSDAKVDAESQTWTDFIRVFNDRTNGLKDKYSLYLFQYCSDRENVAVIASSLRDLTDEKLIDRDHVIVAHSLGGLIAKTYMAQTEHKQGNWKGKKGGETALELITLATPHHGTPGANDSETFRDLVPERYRGAFEALQKIYWLSKSAGDRYVVLSPTAANRSDLRWDNYDGQFNAASRDINVDLARTNADFEPYMSKLIAYGGVADAKLTPLEMAALVIEAQLVDDNGIRQHRMLTFANMGLVWGLGHHFGDADGLVPYVSSLDCRSTRSQQVKARSYVCESGSRVRRFEIGDKTGEVPASELPDQKTLSIFRSPRGFDHLDMLTSPDVLRYVVKDLGAMERSVPIKPVKSQ
jgi:triacylglycerol esterase/lipase EstA (alpha/beta hydrolase family)